MNEPTGSDAVDDTPRRSWFGYEQTSEVVAGRESEVVTVPSSMWSEEHRRRLLQSQTINGLVPTIGLRRTYESSQAYQLPAPGRTLTDALDSRAVSGFDEIVSAVEAAAEATHAGHLSGLFHGALGSDDIHVVGNEIAVSGMGLGHGGSPEEHRTHFVAPEVVAGGVPSVRSDVYGLGRVLEAGLGRMQGAAPTDAQRLITEATDSDPANRPPSAHAFATRLGGLSGRRRRRYGLAALGSSVAAKQLATAINDRDSTGGAAAGAAGAVGAGVATTSGFAVAKQEPTTAAAVVTEPVAAAATSDRRRRGAGVALAGLVALGGLGLYALSRDGDDEPEVAGIVQENEDASTTTAAPSTTAVPSTTAAPTTTAVPSTTAAPTTEEETTTTTEAATNTTEAAGASGDDEPPVVGPMTADDAANSFEILHAVPGTAVDVYVDGALAAPEFVPGTLAGPLPLSTSGQPIDLFASMDDPPVSIDDRDDKPLLAGPIDIDGPGTLVAFVDDAGAPVLQAFANNLDPVPAGQGRLAVRHVAGVGPATVIIDGEEVATDVPAGSSVVLDVPAGMHSIQVVDGKGNELLSQEIEASEGDLTSAWIRGEVDSLTTSVRRIGGLQTAPSGIPSGSSGLADDPFTAVGDGLLPAISLMALMGGAGLVVQHRRRFETGP